MLRNQNLIEIEMPKYLAEISYNSIKDFIREYHTQQNLHHILLEPLPVKCKYDLKWLAVSCYLQGMADAQQALTQKQ